LRERHFSYMGAVSIGKNCNCGPDGRAGVARQTQEEPGLLLGETAENPDFPLDGPVFVTAGQEERRTTIPAFAGMEEKNWIPAFAGMEVANATEGKTLDPGLRRDGSR